MDELTIPIALPQELTAHKLHTITHFPQKIDEERTAN
jgi:hypothetical protein